MTEQELDLAYTRMSEVLTELGEELSPLYLARFALLAMISINDVKEVQRLIEAARPEQTASAG